jgi:hypothetical protein
MEPIQPCIRPPSPPILGGTGLVFGLLSFRELTLVFGFLPPNLGGRGGQCKMFETCLYTVAQEL